MTGPTDPVLNQEWRRARRQLARTLHPDRGGDLGTSQASAAGIDRSFENLEREKVRDRRLPLANPAGRRPTASGSHEAQAASIIVVRRTWRTKARRPAAVVQSLLRTAQTALPRGLPGARRYTEL